MTTRQRKAWYVSTGGTLGVIIAVIALCGSLGWVLPWQAATKEEISASNERISQLERGQSEIIGRLTAIGNALRVEYEPPVKESE